MRKNLGLALPPCTGVVDAPSTASDLFRVRAFSCDDVSGPQGDIESVVESYDLMSQRLFTHASPTLFNAGTPRPQLSSCFLLNVKEDSIEGIYDTLKQVGMRFAIAPPAPSLSCIYSDCPRFGALIVKGLAIRCSGER